MDYRRVKSGDRLSIPAETWNEMIQMVAEGKGGGRGGKSPVVKAKQRNSGIIIAKNTTGAAVSRFHSMKIVGPVISPSANLSQFKNNLMLEITTPDSESAGLWCVAQEQIDAGAFGEVVVLGITIARINLSDEAHTNVDAQSGSTVLASDDSGSGQILWVADGSEGGTGEQWAIIRLPTGGGGGESIPTGEYPYMPYQTVSSNSNVFDFVRISPVFD